MNYQIKEIKPMLENTKEELYRYLADVATVVKDEEIKNPEKLFERLSKESYGNTASSVLAFVPIVLDIKDNDFSFLRNISFLQLFGFFKDGKYHTNLREILNDGKYSLDEAIKLIDFTHYKAFTAVVEEFTYNQIRTHTQVQFLQQSNRRAYSKYGYFCPPEFKKYLENELINYIPNDSEAEEHWNKRVLMSTPDELFKFMQVNLGIKRREVFSRGADMLEIRKFSIGVNTLNPNSWGHLRDERKTSHTQLECRNFITELSECIDK